MNTALLAIDLQRDFLEETGRLPIARESQEPLIANANRLFQFAAATGWKIVIVRNEFRRWDWTGNFFRKWSAIEGSKGAEIDPRITVPAGIPLCSKASANAFTNPDLEAALKQAGITRIVAFGIMTEECVLDTSRAAIHKGYAVTVVSDAVASMNETDRTTGLKKLREAGAEFRTTAEIIATAGAATSPAQRA